MARVGKLLNYDELLAQYPEWILWRTDAYYKETTEEATENARLRCLLKTGYATKFIQDNGLTKRVLCENAPHISDRFFIYLRDITPEGLEFYRTGYMKWLNRFQRNMDADPSDVRVMEKALSQMRVKSRKSLF